MIRLPPNLIPPVRLLGAALLPTLVLTGIRGLSGANFEWAIFLQIWLFVFVVLYLAPICQPKAAGRELIQFHPASIGLILIAPGLGILYWLTENTLIAWLLLACMYALVLGWVTTLGSNIPLWRRLLLEGAFTLATALLPTLIVQIETRFSSEEYFVALETAILMIIWLALRGMFALSKRRNSTTLAVSGWQIQRRWIILGLILGSLGFNILAMRSYQSSFFPPTVPGFSGITAESPFICGETQVSQDTYQGRDIYIQLLDQVEHNPTKHAPELGFLALGTGDQEWAVLFRDSILGEAQSGLFTEPTGSVKYGQYLASQRVYFYPRVRDNFPGLFTPSQEQIIQDWFAAINRRTFTVEWVDWLYALAFRYWPHGPYENQENGAGLLSLLESSDLAAPELSSKNQQYLANNNRGWLTNFSVTDDAAVYQPEWIENAWFQSLYTEEINTSNQQLSFDWLMLLALPDGSPLRYNHPGYVEYANSAYWGANLLNDPTLMWLAGRALEILEKSQANLTGQAGVEQQLSITGTSPKVGSCLVYGNSGLPTQKGPLAPDKLVFRSGWEPDDIYLLLNLRFTGWHRYKATNAVVQIYQNEPLVVENYAGNSFDWLPIGRSLFRDKRIPRENLNGLVIGKIGLAKVLYQLTGFGGPWAQDPPYYAEVTRFDTNPGFDISTTLIENWHGWQHQRTIYFYPEGIVAVFDNAQGPKDHPAAFIWHLVGDAIPEGNRIPLGVTPETGTSPEVVLIPINGDQSKIQIETLDGDIPILRVQYSAPSGETLQTVTIFLFGKWLGAEIKFKDGIAHISQDDNHVKISLDEVWNK